MCGLGVVVGVVVGVGVGFQAEKSRGGKQKL